MLVRKFIGRRLAEYYAQPANAVVGSTNTTATSLSSSSSSVNLGRLLGEWHWRRVYKQLYLEQEGHWLTPVELFKPYYSNSLANFVANAVGTTTTTASAAETTLTNSSTSISSSPSSFDRIDVVELGGGRGTNAKLILDHLQEAHPLVYQRVNYIVMDSSPSLLELQRETLLSSVHADKVQFESKDMLDVAEQGTSFLPPSKRPTVVLALELFDNLPHDKIRVRAGRVTEQAEVRQRNKDKTLKTEIATSESKTAKDGDLNEEVFCKLSDPLLSKVLDMAPTYTRTPISWVPTVACGVLQRLIQERPNAQLLMADFDWLPAPDRLDADAPARLSHWAEGEPLTTSMDSTDFECYLQAPPFCDVLFPTNFGKLASFVRTAWRGQGDVGVGAGVVTVHKQADFLQLYGPEQVQLTKSWLTGFSPLLHDFANCSVLSVTRPPPAAKVDGPPSP
jgi:hypothetical protein